ncbi:hypothetical protein [Corynebacterium pygosceleis]|uniref:hypothetical protein n=1 Tax=Corynebacterium pygosceleis TaxID=2800406 RepID=UPI0019042228|nr:hypothetical protein [Corynebacterium pygosceleis]MCL0120082.1 hypothetical protein [Corynebacterium pygosceleis]
MTSRVTPGGGVDRRLMLTLGDWRRAGLILAFILADYVLLTGVLMMFVEDGDRWNVLYIGLVLLSGALVWLRTPADGYRAMNLTGAAWRRHHIVRSAVFTLITALVVALVVVVPGFLPPRALVPVGVILAAAFLVQVWRGRSMPESRSRADDGKPWWLTADLGMSRGTLIGSSPTAQVIRDPVLRFTVIVWVGVLVYLLMIRLLPWGDFREADDLVFVTIMVLSFSGSMASLAPLAARAWRAYGWPRRDFVRDWNVTTLLNLPVALLVWTAAWAVAFRGTISFHEGIPVFLAVGLLAVGGMVLAPWAVGRNAWWYASLVAVYPVAFATAATDVRVVSGALAGLTIWTLILLFVISPRLAGTTDLNGATFHERFSGNRR